MSGTGPPTGMRRRELAGEDGSTTLLTCNGGIEDAIGIYCVTTPTAARGNIAICLTKELWSWR